VRALEEAGYILGYHAEIDRQKIGLGVLAFVRIDADRNTGEATREAGRRHQEDARGRGLPLHQRHRHLRAAGGGARPDGFSQFARKVLINLPNVKDLHTSFSLGQVKDSSALPLGHLAG
jgi:Lrp/AsnC family leucine-responsive transcriptional regulator